MSEKDDKKNPVVAFLTEMADQHDDECPVSQICHGLIVAINAGHVTTGPAQVATAQYRSNWDATFSKKASQYGAN
jgi:putative intracellular protease/amidase